MERIQWMDMDQIQVPMVREWVWALCTTVRTITTTIITAITREQARVPHQEWEETREVITGPMALEMAFQNRNLDHLVQLYPRMYQWSHRHHHLHIQCATTDPAIITGTIIT